MSMRTSLGKVRGLGSARQGTEHFWRQRVTAVANVPLSLFMIGLVITVVGRPFDEVHAILSSPVVAILLLAAILSAVVHMRLGVQTVVEDYIHGEAAKVVILMANTFFSALIGIACVWAVAKLSFGI